MTASSKTSAILAILVTLAIASHTFADEAADRAAAKAREEKRLADKERTALWAHKLGIWRTWYHPGSDDPAQTPAAAAALIAAIDDPLATPAIVELLPAENHPPLRLALIDALVKLGGGEAVEMLVRVSAEDRSPWLRERAALGLAGKPELASHRQKYIAYLYLPRFSTAAAMAVRQNELIARKPDESLDPKLTKALIAALIQKQKQQVRYWVDDFRDGLPPRIRFEGYDNKYQWTEVLVPRPNEEVLQTLKEYSGQDFGYNQRLWTRKLLIEPRK